MIKNLRFVLFSMLLMLCGNVFAGTIVFSGLSLENGVQYSDPFDGGDFTVTFGGGANDGKYYTTGEGIRVYGGGTMTIAAKSGKLTKVTITYDGSNKPTSADVVDNGTYDVQTGVWTGDAEQVVFTRPSGSGHWRVQKVSTDEEPVVVEIPAVDGIGAFNELNSGTEAQLNLTDNVQVVFKNVTANGREYIILQDDNKARIVLYNMGLAEAMNVNDVLTGYIVGKNSPYNGMAEMAKTSNTSAETFTATAGDAKVDALANVSAALDPMKLLKLCKITKVNLEKDGTKDYAFDESGRIQIYDAYGVGYTLPELEEGQTVTITGIVLPYKKGDADLVYEICPISQEAIEVVNPPYFKKFAETEVFIPTTDALAAGQEEGWIDWGGTATTNKTLAIDPYTDEAKQTKSAPGVGLKNGNNAKSFVVRVKGVDAIWSYGASTGSSNRTLKVIATDESGKSVSAQETTNSATATVKLENLSADANYTVVYTGFDEDGTSGADVVLHAVKFIVDGKTTTGIETVKAEQNANAIYNLQGQRVQNAVKGLYIVGGKKVLF